jgi:2-methylcitrate dehydratase PrpD
MVAVPIIGRNEKFDPANAALIHAFTSNILDYDDTHWPTGIHPAGTVASALVAWSSQTIVSGKEFLHAFLLGMEVECRIGLAVSPGHYERGCILHRPVESMVQLLLLDTSWD